MGQPAREWSRGDASDIDGQTDRSNERARMSQSRFAVSFMRWLRTPRAIKTA